MPAACAQRTKSIPRCRRSQSRCGSPWPRGSAAATWCQRSRIARVVAVTSTGPEATLARRLSERAEFLVGLEGRHAAFHGGADLVFRADELLATDEHLV